MVAEATGPNLAERMMIGTLIYYTPVLICLGIIGNCLSIGVFFRTEMRRSSSSFYLAALATSDIGFLLSIAVRWFKIFDINVFRHEDFCKFFVYLTTICSIVSVWFIVGFTIERFIAVRYPLRRQVICTVARAKTVIIALTCVAPLLGSPLLWMVSSRASSKWYMPACTVVEEWKSQAFVFVIVNTVTTFVLPFTVIAVLNGLIVKTVWRRAGLRVTLTNSSTTSCNDENSSNQRPSGSSVGQTKITKMLLIVSSVFLGLNLPAYTLRVYSFSQTGDVSRTVQSIQLIFDRVYDTSFGINFFLYCVSGQNFRQELLRMICCCSKCWSFTKLNPNPSIPKNGAEVVQG